MVKQVLLIICMLGIAFFHAFATGLAGSTIKYHIHYKSLILNSLVFVFLIGITVGGILLTIRSDFD